jgi:tight adherence protein C
MILLLLAAAGVAGGVWLIGSAIWPAPLPLARATRRLHTAAVVTVGDTVDDGTLVVRAGRIVVPLARSRLGGRRRLRTDLAIVRRPLEVHLGLTVVAFAATLIGVPLAVTAIAAVAGLHAPWALLAVTPILAVGAVAAVHTDLTARARRARRDFVHALGAYLDVLVLLLAAHEGVENAMVVAANTGTGPTFEALRRATIEAHSSGVPVWHSLRQLAERIDVEILAEIADAGRLAGEDGAAIRRTVMTKARSVRARALDTAETEAKQRSRQLFLPIVAMGTGFMVFLIYPLLTTIRIA